MKFTTTATLLSMTAAVVATPWGEPPASTVTATVTVTAPSSAPTGGAPAGQCNVGDTYCCQSLMTNEQAGIPVLDGLLGLVGVGCLPINILGSTCSASPVCCTGTAEGGLVNIGCLPIIL